VTVLNTILPAGSSLVSFVFAALVFDQWRQRRRSFQLVWTLGLLWYGISAGTEALGSGLGWNADLYRVWYLVGALFVAAYLGAGTVYLLAKTHFGYMVGASILIGGLITLAARDKYPGSDLTAYTVFGVCLVGAAAVATATATRRQYAPHIAFGLLVAASAVVAVLVLTAPLHSPGYATDPGTGVPVGSAMPSYIRVLPITFNVAGAFCLVLGAKYSAYIYMPKRKLLRARRLPPIAAQLYGVLAVIVNLAVSLPGAIAAVAAGRVNSRVPATLLIALGGFIPGVTSALNRFGITWSFFLGEFLGVLMIFIGFLISEEVFARARNRAAAEENVRPTAAVR
jgi:hypothetical protein